MIKAMLMAKQLGLLFGPNIEVGHILRHACDIGVYLVVYIG